MRAYVQAGGRDDDECARGHCPSHCTFAKKKKSALLLHRLCKPCWCGLGCSLRLVVLRVELSVEDLAHQPRQLGHL